MTRILITVTTGQVGHALMKRLDGFAELLACQRSPDKEVYLDFADPASIGRCLDDYKPQLVINPAAYTAVDKAESESELAYRINAEGVGVLAEEAKRRQISLIHFSTDYVFPGTGQLPWKETDGTKPLNQYGRSKLSGEKLIFESGADAIILRTSWVYSHYGQNFVKTMLRLGCERHELKVIDDQVGAPTSAQFLADMVAGILNSSTDPARAVRDRSGLYHLVCGGETSWHGFAQEVFRLANKMGMPIVVRSVLPIKSKEYPTAAQRPLNSRLDCQKFYDAFPNLLQTPWQEALREVMQLLD